MTASNETWSASRTRWSSVGRVDRAVSAFRRWVEDLLPWYDRQEQHERIERTERIRRKSIQARIRNEAILAQRRIGR